MPELEIKKDQKRIWRTTSWLILTESLESCFRHMRDKKVIGNGCYGFIKDKSCLASMFAFGDKIISSGEGCYFPWL